MKTTVAIFLDTRRPLQDTTYPVKIRVTHQRKRRYFAINNEYSSLTEADFNKSQGSVVRGKYQDIRDRLKEKTDRAEAVVKKLGDKFSFTAFEEIYLGKKNTKTTVYDYYQRRIDELMKDGSAGTIGVYQCARTSLKDFHSRPLSFEKITPDFLKDYERWSLAKGNSITTISMYLRTLRTLYNMAIEDGVCQRENYPFGKRRYAVPANRNVKKALPLADIGKLFAYEPTTEAEGKHRDLWLFSYLANGMNVKDIARLRYRHIEGGRLTFVRAKTEYTTRTNQKPIVVMLTDEAQAIVKRWGTEPTRPDAYVFGLLAEGLDPEEERKAIKQLTKQINKYIGRIAKAVGIEAHVTTYTARHSYATVLKRSGAPVEFISESLGHADIRTTENYLDSFEDDTKRKYANALTAFD